MDDFDRVLNLPILKHSLAPVLACYSESERLGELDKYSISVAVAQVVAPDPEAQRMWIPVPNQ